MARKRNKITKPKVDVFAIVVDGQTEVWYFQMMKRNETELLINIEPKIPQKKKLSEQYNKVVEFAQDYVKVFWIIDLDVIIKESKEVKKGQQSKIQELKQYLADIENKFDNVITILNNPCLEFWFLLHFKRTARYFQKCEEVEKDLKHFLTDYEKTRKYFIREGNDIYLRLKPFLTIALENARRLQRISLDNLERAICEMNLFFDTEQIRTSIR